MSTRRTLICVIAGGLLPAGRAGRAQTPGKVYRIGWLSSGPWAGTQPLEAGTSASLGRLVELPTRSRLAGLVGTPHSIRSSVNATGTSA